MMGKDPGGTGRVAREPQSRAATTRLLQALAVAALVFPLVGFLFASWFSYRATQVLANERVERSLDVMEEQALKVFQSMSLAVDVIDRLLARRSDAAIRADEPRLHAVMLQILGALPGVQSIWILGPTGHPQVVTHETPAPVDQDYSQENYFMVPRDNTAQVYIGGLHDPVSAEGPHFTFNRAHHSSDGSFGGVISMSLVPGDFSRFYSHLASTPGIAFALVREDGTVLAHYPPTSAALHFDQESGFRRAIATDPGGGTFTIVGRIDNLRRRVGYRKILGYPVYVNAGIDTAEIRREWMADLAPHLLFGIPATLLLFGLLLVVLQRTRHLYAEQDRREAAEIAMRQSQRLDAVGRLTGGVAHDFNNLLTIIIGNLETIQRQAVKGLDASRERMERAAENAMQGARRAVTLTQRLLAFARLHPLDPRPLDLNRLLNEFSDFLTRSLGEKVSLEMIGAAGLWPVTADPSQLETALLNLAVNARDAMPTGGKLTIETSNAHIDEAYARSHPDVQPGQYVLVGVTDTGTGMSRETLESAFEPFFTTKPAGQGTGLGLSQVYGFVKQSGGHVKIYSEAGHGTTIKIYLPRFAGAVAARQKAEDADAVPAHGSGEHIFVVEDDKDVREYIVEALRGLNYTVSEAADAEQALASLKGEDFDLLLTDVILPGMNGRQLADALSASRRGLKNPVHDRIFPQRDRAPGPP